MKFVSIRRKLILTMIGSFVLLIMLTSSILLYEFNNIFKTRMIDDLNQIMQQNRSSIEHFVNNIDQATLMLYADRTISNILTQREEDFVRSVQDRELVHNQLIKYVYIPLNSIMTAYEVTFFASEEAPFATSLSESNLLITGVFNSKAVADTPWYLETKAKDGELHWFHFPSHPGRFYVARLIKNDEDLEGIQRKYARMNLGVVVIQFNVDQLMNQLESSKLTEGAEVILISPDGVFAQRQDGRIQESIFRKAVLSNHKADANVYGEEIAFNGKQYLLHHELLPSGWRIAVLTPIRDIESQLLVVRDKIATASIIGLLFAFALSYFISVQTSKPIRKLVQIMQRIHHTDSIKRAKASTARSIAETMPNDEIGLLYNSFQNMMNRIQGLIDDVYASGIKEKEAELKALQAQINPHFLYNTLDSVNWMAMSARVPDIANVVSSLADLLRYSIKKPGELVTLADEVEVLRRYLHIQEVCYDHEWKVEWSLDSNALNAPSPKLILQPLVENAVRHGIEQTGMKGVIQISAVCNTEGYVQVIVENTAPQHTDIDSINLFLLSKGHMKETGGYGIRNVDQRVKILFGNSYGLAYERGDNDTIRAIVKLPVQP